MTDRLTVHPVTTEGQLLQQISNQLDELIDLVRPTASVVAGHDEPASADAPVTGVPEPKPAAAKKAPAKKATTRKRVTGQ